MANGASTNFHMIVEESFWPLRSNPTALRRLPMPSGVGRFLRQQAARRHRGEGEHRLMNDALPTAMVSGYENQSPPWAKYRL